MCFQHVFPLRSEARSLPNVWRRAVREKCPCHFGEGRLRPVVGSCFYRFTVSPRRPFFKTWNLSPMTWKMCKTRPMATKCHTWYKWSTLPSKILVSKIFPREKDTKRETIPCLDISLCHPVALMGNKKWRIWVWPKLANPSQSNWDRLPLPMKAGVVPSLKVRC